MFVPSASNPGCVDLADTQSALTLSALVRYDRTAALSGLPGLACGFACRLLFRCCVHPVGWLVNALSAAAPVHPGLWRLHWHLRSGRA
jgi:hypothetical protein